MQEFFLFSFFVISLTIVYIIIANIPIKNPIIFPTPVILPWYSLFASGVNSPRNYI